MLETNHFPFALLYGVIKTEAKEFNLKRVNDKERSYVTIRASWKVSPKFFKFVVCNPCFSSPSLKELSHGVLSRTKYPLNGRKTENNNLLR